MLKVNNLSICYTNNNKKDYLLNDICFELNDTDCLGIIGKSGDGKTTLAKALIGLYDHNIIWESGRITIDNIPFNNSFRGKKIALVFQNPNSYLNPLMKVGKQIEEMLTYHEKMNKKAAKLKTIELMEKVGFSNASVLYNYYPYELSGGMQQKICLCIALICQPQIIIFDESTSYLDKESKKEIIDLIKMFQKERNFSLIVISHDFNEICSLCNKIAIMRKGQIIEFGYTDELLLNPKHPYTIELLCDYLRFYKDIEMFTCPLMQIELEEAPQITMISPTHYVRSWYLNKNALKIELPKNINKIKEDIYENLRNK